MKVTRVTNKFKYGNTLGTVNWMYWQKHTKVNKTSDLKSLAWGIKFCCTTSFVIIRTRYYSHSAQQKQFHVWQEKLKKKKKILLHRPPTSSTEKEANATSIENSLQKASTSMWEKEKKTDILFVHSTIL